MADKSRRNRLNKSRNHPITSGSNTAVYVPDNQNILSQPKTKDQTADAGNKNTQSSASDLSYIGNEIKWIGIVTGIVVIILAVLYFLVR